MGAHAGVHEIAPKHAWLCAHFVCVRMLQALCVYGYVCYCVCVVCVCVCVCACVSLREGRCG